MNSKIIKTLFKKEMLEVFRDKKTVIMMLIIPVIIYPLMFIVGLQAANMISNSMKTATYNVVIAAEDNGLLKNKLAKDSETEEGYNLQFLELAGESYEEALQAESIDVYVGSALEDGKIVYQIYYISSADNSSYAADIIADAVDELKKEIRKEKLTKLGMDAESILEPVAVSYENVATAEQSTGSMIGTILPFMLVISLMMGTMYPAIDVTAGEKERGTLETVLTLPVTNRQLIMSKFLTVALIGVISAALNLLSMGFITLYMIKMMAGFSTAFESISIVSFVPSLIITILAVFVFALFISAITMCFTAFANSYKEASNYITPLMLVVMFVAFIGFIPNVELNYVMASVPVANICLLIKNIMLFKIDLTIVGLVLLSSVCYALLAIWVLSRIYDSESVLFGEGKVKVQLFEKRSNIKRGGPPTLGDALFVLLITLVLTIYLGGYLQVKLGLGGVLGTQLIILLVPLAMVFYTKKEVKETYSFKQAKLSGYLGGLLAITGSVMIGIVVSALMARLVPDSYSSAVESMTRILNQGLVPSLLVLALAPAVCEEMFFRGYIYTALKHHFKPAAAIAIVAVAFGVFHMSIAKLPVTGLLGAVLCYAVYASGSIYPAMIMHLANNAFAILVSYYPEVSSKYLPFLEADSPVSVIILAAGGVLLLAAGLAVLNYGRRNRENELAR